MPKPADRSNKTLPIRKILKDIKQNEIEVYSNEYKDEMITTSQRHYLQLFYHSYFKEFILKPVFQGAKRVLKNRKNFPICGIK